MRKIEIGNRYGRLVILGESPTTQRKRRVICRCDCGNEKSSYLGHLKNGGTRSCGCLKSEETVKRNTRLIEGVPTLSHPLHGIWKGMLNRCYNPKNGCFERYGGKGVKVCMKWRNSFASFVEDMGPRPKGMTMDRIDNGGNYEPSNCHWATLVQQANNKRNNRWLEFRGEKLTLAQWSKKLGYRGSVLRNRLVSGWSVERALTTPVQR